MKFQCPVAKCGEMVSPDTYYIHVKKYEEKYKGNPILTKSHDRFCAYFYPQIWNSGHSLKYKYRNIAKKYIEDQKKLKIQKKDKTVEDYEQGRFKRGTISELMGDLHR